MRFLLILTVNLTIKNTEYNGIVLVFNGLILINDFDNYL